MRKRKAGVSMGFLVTVLVVAISVFSGCTTGSSDGTPSGSELANYQKSFMSSYYAERRGTAGGASDKALTPFWKVKPADAKATVNTAYLTSTSFTSLVASASNSIPDYPEINQTTAFVLTLYDAINHVYDVVATTSYPADDARASYVEEYYVKDIGMSGGYYSFGAYDDTWDVNDPIVTDGGGSWVQDQTARVRQVLTFDNGTVRNETIVRQSDSTTNPVHFVAFDIDGSLDFSQVFYPATDTDAVFSSIVIYKVTPATNYGFWFWSGSSSQTILGIRYYTELADAASGKYYGYTICFEKTVSEYATAAESFPATMTTVFVGSTHDTLSESVLRQKTAYAYTGGIVDLSSAVKTTNMKSRVVDVTSAKDFYIEQLNSDYVTLSGWDTTTIGTPAGEAEAIAEDATALAYLETRTVIEQADGSDLSIAVSSTTSDLSILYRSLTEGVYASTTNTTTPAGSLQGDRAAWTFDGKTIGQQIASSAAYQLSTTGSVEAWICMNTIVDTAGIVHKGVAADFSDECYSLQLWGNAGLVAIVLDHPGTGNSFDYIYSGTKLKAGKWYHIVATWDTATSKKICLYVNGSLSNSKTPSTTLQAAGCRNNDAGLVIGSQLPSIYSTLYGYFSFDGKIVGTRIYTTALTAAEVLANYNAYKDLTYGW